jgi:small-conductance mechanosensitive channel
MHNYSYPVILTLKINGLKLMWVSVKMLKLVVLLFAVLIVIIVYAISYCFGKLLKGRVIPIFGGKG